MAQSSHAVEISKFTNGTQERHVDSVAVEEPLEIRLGWSTPDGRATRSISITMRTPGDDTELAVGFLLSESIIHAATDVASIDVCGEPAPDSGNYNTVKVELNAGVDVDLGRLQRHFYTSSSCGVCGKTSLDALRATGATSLRDDTAVFSKDILTTIPGKLRESQATFDTTGGLHAAAAFTRSGKLVMTMEDVGRHNAVDKVIGALSLAGQLPASELGLMVSGRASFELMQKALVAGMPLLAAVSAPSSLAVQLAQEFDLTLVGFLRGETFNIYSGKQRISA
jgi:FdhD protein